MEKVNTLTGAEKIVLRPQQVHPLGKGNMETAPKFPKETTTSYTTFPAVSQQAPGQTQHVPTSAPTAAQNHPPPFPEQIPRWRRMAAAAREPSQLPLLMSGLLSLLQGPKEKPTPGYHLLATDR